MPASHSSAPFQTLSCFAPVTSGRAWRLAIPSQHLRIEPRPAGKRPKRLRCDAHQIPPKTCSPWKSRFRLLNGILGYWFQTCFVRSLYSLYGGLPWHQSSLQCHQEPSAPSDSWCSNLASYLFSLSFLFHIRDGHRQFYPFQTYFTASWSRPSLCHRRSGCSQWSLPGSKRSKIWQN